MMLKAGLTLTSRGNGRAVKSQRRETGRTDFENPGDHDAVASGRLVTVAWAMFTVRQLGLPFLCTDQLVIQYRTAR
jgi:hypothetical protein